MEATSNRTYQRAYIFTQLTGITILVLLLVLLIKYFDGLNFTSSLFNFHPLLMVLGFVLLYSNTALLYRTGRSAPKWNLKIGHATLNGLIALMISLALTAVVKSKNSSGSSHLKTLHSWLGILTCILFVGQFIGGFTAYLYPGFSLSSRKTIMPYHRLNGLLIFVLAVATCLTGLNEKAIFSVPNYMAALSTSGILVNVISLLLIIFATLTVFLLARREYRREPLPSD